jgi:hypothetical protein
MSIYACVNGNAIGRPGWQPVHRQTVTSEHVKTFYRMRGEGEAGGVGDARG